MEKIVMDQIAYDRTKEQFISQCKSAQPSGIRPRNTEQFGKDFDELCSDERLRYVCVRDGVLFLVTYPLVIRAVNTGKAHGPVEYIIQINPANKNITCENVEGLRRFGERDGHHPHVFSSMLPCLSANSAQVQKDFADGRLGKVGLLMLDFLEIARGENDYIPPYAWPEMDQKDIEQCLKQRQAGTK